MKRINRVAVGVAACLLLAGPALAQTCNDHIRAVAPDSRYTDHGNGTVTDNATGLMWKQCREGLTGPGCATNDYSVFHGFGWQGALRSIHQGITFAGYSDWRLPNVNELASLVEERCYDPAINLTLFPNTHSGFFWSSSPSRSRSFGSSSGAGALAVDFENGYVIDSNYSFGNYNTVRLVRGGE